MLYDRTISGGFGEGILLLPGCAHALHPNVPEKNDITNFPVLNGSVTLKIACSQSYAGDAEAIAIAKSLCSGTIFPARYS